MPANLRLEPTARWPSADAPRLNRESLAGHPTFLFRMADTVALIFDPEFADRLREMTTRDLWIIRSPANSMVVDDLRRAGVRLTTFEDHFGPEVAAFDEILRTIELHHGEYSQDPPFQRLEVFGLEFDDAFQESLHAVGFELSDRTPDGFTAQRAADSN
jgi:hypothetical protein